MDENKKSKLFISSPLELKDDLEEVIFGSLFLIFVMANVGSKSP